MLEEHRPLGVRQVLALIALASQGPLVSETFLRALSSYFLLPASCFLFLKLRFWLENWSLLLHNMQKEDLEFEATPVVAITWALSRWEHPSGLPLVPQELSGLWRGKPRPTARWGRCCGKEPSRRVPARTRAGVFSTVSLSGLWRPKVTACCGPPTVRVIRGDRGPCCCVCTICSGTWCHVAWGYWATFKGSGVVPGREGHAEAALDMVGPGSRGLLQWPPAWRVGPWRRKTRRPSGGPGRCGESRRTPLLRGEPPAEAGSPLHTGCWVRSLLSCSLKPSPGSCGLLPRAPALTVVRGVRRGGAMSGGEASKVWFCSVFCAALKVSCKPPKPSFPGPRGRRGGYWPRGWGYWGSQDIWQDPDQ